MKTLNHTNETFFDFVVRIVSNAPQGASISPQATTLAESPKKRSYLQTDNWSTDGMWVIAVHDAWKSYVGGDELPAAGGDFFNRAESFGLTVRPDRSYNEIGEGYCFCIPHEEQDSEEQKNAWNKLRSALFNSESRNFFYIGHGANNGIGMSPNSTNRFISSDEITIRLHTVAPYHPNRHGYRFVFLYGCQTAKGNLPKSFGMIHKENVPLSSYLSAALTPSVFVGFTENVTAGFGNNFQVHHRLFIQNFLYEWGRKPAYAPSVNGGVKYALDRARENYSYPFSVSLDVEKIKVFGYWGLYPNGCNTLSYRFNYQQ